MESKKKPALHTPVENEDGMTKLHYAAYAGNLDGIIECFDLSMDVNAQDDGGWTALHWLADMAATGGLRIAILEKLIDAGADVNIQSNDGLTALRRACYCGGEDADLIAEKLIFAGADPNIRTKDSTCLHAVTSNPTLTKVLIDAGASVSERDENGLTPIELAQLQLKEHYIYLQEEGEFDLEDEVALLYKKVIEILTDFMGKLTSG